MKKYYCITFIAFIVVILLQGDHSAQTVPPVALK